MVVADVGEERTSLEQASEHSGEPLASSTNIILEQVREHSSDLLATVRSSGKILQLEIAGTPLDMPALCT
jgi:hypothetical protein